MPWSTNQYGEPEWVSEVPAPVADNPMMEPGNPEFTWARDTPAQPAATGGQSRGAVPNGFGSWAEYDAWVEAFKKEHGGMDPTTYYRGDLNRAIEEKQASQVWAAQHGNPASWGYGALNTRVPLSIFQRLASARRSPDVGPLGPQAWAQAADDIGGALLAMQGQSYHPASAVQSSLGNTTADKKKMILQQMAQILAGGSGYGGGLYPLQ